MKICPLRNLDIFLYFQKVTLDSLFPISKTCKITNFALNCCCTYIHGPKSPLLFLLNASPQVFLTATILSIPSLARAVSLINSPWIRHYWAMSTQETAGNSQLASLGIIEQSCSYRLDKLNHMKTWGPGWSDNHISSSFELITWSLAALPFIPISDLKPNMLLCY